MHTKHPESSPKKKINNFLAQKHSCKVFIQITVALKMFNKKTIKKSICWRCTPSEKLRFMISCRQRKMCGESVMRMQSFEFVFFFLRHRIALYEEFVFISPPRANSFPQHFSCAIAMHSAADIGVLQQQKIAFL
jgi:hypothetical protein